jgi:hypothetical protein
MPTSVLVAVAVAVTVICMPIENERARAAATVSVQRVEALIRARPCQLFRPRARLDEAAWRPLKTSKMMQPRRATAQSFHEPNHSRFGVPCTSQTTTQIKLAMRFSPRVPR